MKLMVRVPAHLKKRLQRTAKQQFKTESAVLREALFAHLPAALPSSRRR
jgi:predicted DNA-binding protein